MSSEESTPIGLLISGDLMITSQVQSAAGQLQRTVRSTANPDAVRELLAANPISCLIIDLATPKLDLEAVVADASRDPRIQTVAFGPHVDVARLERAKASGVDRVLPRSRFTSTLREVLRSALSPE